MKWHEHVVVAAAHEVPQRAPIQVNPGDKVTVGERDTTWPAFILVRAETGEGWIPERYVAIDGTQGVIHTPYDTTELPTSVGELLRVITVDEMSGWVWCQNELGREGWVPMATVSPT